MIHSLQTPSGVDLYYRGREASSGPLPAFFYFSLSGRESLELSPYNTPATYFGDECRVFSWTIPGHEEGLDKYDAMQFWADAMLSGKTLLEDFFEAVTADIDWLIAENVIKETAMGVGGLSRGAFVATHIAAKEKRIQALLGFAPLTRLEPLHEFEPLLGSEQLSRLALETLTPDLTHLRHSRFYIAGRDTRVSTRACFDFVSAFYEQIHIKSAKRCHLELFIKPPLGMHGHGTAPHIFEEGTLWMKQHLLS